MMIFDPMTHLIEQERIRLAIVKNLKCLVSDRVSRAMAAKHSRFVEEMASHTAMGANENAKVTPAQLEYIHDLMRIYKHNIDLT